MSPARLSIQRERRPRPAAPVQAQKTEAEPAEGGGTLFPPCCDHQPENKPHKFQVWSKGASFPLSASVCGTVSVFPQASQGRPKRSAPAFSSACFQYSRQLEQGGVRWESGKGSEMSWRPFFHESFPHPWPCYGPWCHMESEVTVLSFHPASLFLLSSSPTYQGLSSHQTHRSKDKTKSTKTE